MKDLAHLLKQIAAPIDRGEKFNIAIERAARLSGLSYSRAFNIWYGKAKRIEPHEETAILSALVEKRLADEKNELHALKISLARLETQLSQTQAALARAQADGNRAAIDALRPYFRQVG